MGLACSSKKQIDSNLEVEKLSTVTSPVEQVQLLVNQPNNCDDIHQEELPNLQFEESNEPDYHQPMSPARPATVTTQSEFVPDKLPELESLPEPEFSPPKSLKSSDQELRMEQLTISKSLSVIRIVPDLEIYSFEDDKEYPAFIKLKQLTQPKQLPSIVAPKKLAAPLSPSNLPKEKVKRRVKPIIQKPVNCDGLDELEIKQEEVTQNKVVQKTNQASDLRVSVGVEFDL